MRESSLLFSSFAVLCLLGCGGSGDTQSGGSESASSSGSGGAGMGGASGASSSKSSSGSVSSSSASSSASSTSSSSTGGGACGTITLAEDNGAQKQYMSICANSWGGGQTKMALGYLAQGPGMAAPRIIIQGCQSAAAMSPGIKLTAEDAMAPGDYTIGLTDYTDMTGKVFGMQGDPFDVNVTVLDMVGGAIDGTFKVKVSSNGLAAHTVEGSFHVCRVNDELLP